MYFQHAADVWRDFPSLVPDVLYAEGITGDAAVGPDHLTAVLTPANPRFTPARP